MSFLNWIYKNLPATKTKHAASKKGFAHKHNLSRGQLNHQKFISK